MLRTCLPVVGLCILLGGCAAPTTPPQPNVAMPLDWNEPVSPDAPALDAAWWQRFSSAELSHLIEAALRQSTDLAVATEQVRQAEIQLRIAGASLYPSLDLEVDASRRRNEPASLNAATREATAVSLSARYEIDFWGRNAAQIRAGSARFVASRHDRQTVRVTLTSGVADTYVRILALRERLAIARDNLAIAERVLDVVAARARYGTASQLDLIRQRTTVFEQRTALLPLQLQERQTRAALAALIGVAPQAFEVAAGDLYSLEVPQADAGIPSELLSRRPDLAASEARLLAAHADLQAARAALFPNLQLVASGGLASNALLSLTDPAHSAGISLALVQNIFDAGRLRASTELAASRERELLEVYRQTILTALAEVDNALSAVAHNAAQERLQEQVLGAANAALRLAELRYRAGSDDLLAVLDAQRTLFQAQDQRAQLRLARLQSALTLFKALGGGWHKPLPEPSLAATDFDPR